MKWPEIWRSFWTGTPVPDTPPCGRWHVSLRGGSADIVVCGHPRLHPYVRTKSDACLAATVASVRPDLYFVNEEDFIVALFPYGVWRSFREDKTEESP